MQRTNWSIATVILGICTASLQPQVAGAQPVTISANVSSSTNLVWDVGAVMTQVSVGVTNKDGTSTVEASYPVVVTQNGAGRIEGRAANPAVTLIADGFQIRFSGGSYVISGSITSSKGKGHLLLNANLSGSSTLTGHRIKVSHKVNVRFDNVAQTVSGTITDSAFASTRGTITEHTDVAEPLDSMFTGNGTWTLTLNDLVTTGNKVQGTARVLLNSGQSFNYTVHGIFASSTGISKLTLTAADKATHGSALQVVVNAGSITSIHGSISGQAVKVKF